jgi:hypothetical protein
MKRVLMFVLLFGGGLALLLYLSKEQKKEKIERIDPAQEEIVEKGREQQLPFAELPERTEQAVPGPGEKADDRAGTSGFAARARGKLDLRYYLEGEGAFQPLQYDFHADDVQPSEGDYYDITGITAHIYDIEAAGPESRVVLTTLKAERGRARIEQEGTRFTIGRSERIKLFDAVITLHSGTPMAPIDLFLPAAEADLRSNSFYSNAEVRVEGDGIHGTGTGLVAEQDKQQLEFERDGYLRLTADKGTVVELFAAFDSSIVVKHLQQTDESQKIDVRLDQGGRLVAQGQQELIVEGDELSLIGRVIQLATPDPSEEGELETGKPRRRRGFQAEYAKIVGNAKFTRADERVSGGLAEVRFDPRGRVKRLEMSQQPVATGVLELSQRGGGAKTQVDVRISGAGPMTLEYNEESLLARFELPGPATIAAATRNFVLHASEGIGGSFWGRGLLHLMLRGAVDGRLDEMAFDGSEVELRGSRIEEEARRLFLDTKRPAHLSGLDSKGKPLNVTARTVLQLELDEGRSRLLLGRDVTFELVDEGLWTVAVGELTEMDFEAGTFLADKGIEYSGPLGSGTALRAVGHSREHIELFGDEGHPATFDVYPDATKNLDLGLVRAHHIDLERSRARADSKVELRFAGGKFSEEIDCGWFELRPIGDARKVGPTRFEFEAREISRAVLLGPEAESTVRADLVTGEGVFTRSPETGTSIELERLEATGDVQVDYVGRAGTFVARGQRIEWRPLGGGRLEAPVGERVEARGRFQQDGLPYVLTAAWIEYGDDELQALFPEISLDRAAALPQLLLGRASTELHSGRAEWMTADAEGLLLAGAAHFSGKSAKGEKIDLDAGSIHLRRTSEGDKRSQGVEELVAWEGFLLHVGNDLVGHGEVLQAGYEVLRMEGRPARLEVLGFAWESDNVVYDVPRVLITTDQGRIQGAAGSIAEGWEVTYESLQPFENADSTMMVMRNPVVRSEGREVRANWAIFWLDRDEWLRKTQEWLADGASGAEEVPLGPMPDDTQAESSAPTLFGRIDARSLSKVLKEVYFEGDIVYTVGARTVARMDAAYVDMVDGHGWIQDCEITVDAKIGRIRTQLIVRADWLRHSADGSLSADHAEVTACDFAEPHYFIRTKNLRFKPVDETGSVWDVSLKDNALVFDNGLSIPLPRAHYKSDGKGRPTFSGLRFGDSARYGAFIEATLDIDVGHQVAETIAPLLNVEPEEIDGNYRIKASYYASRGLLLNQRFRLTAAEHFWMNVYFDGIYDTGEDRGMLRYKDPGQDGFRWVLNTRSRYLMSESEWFDLVYATQSDPGVQAEFAEGEFISYEHRDTYLRWRKAQDEVYYSAEARVRADSFRNDVERLPDLGVMRGLTPFTELWGQPLLYTATADVAFLRRREGSSTLVSPFDPLFTDNRGDVEVLRGDTRHRVETPFDLGLGDIRVSPYVALEGTAWSEGVEPWASPTRGAFIAGAEAQTTLFRTWRHGVVNSVTPFVGYHGDLVSFEDDGTPLKLDNVDESLVGRFADVGLRSRWRVPGGARYLDLSVRGTHADAVERGEEDGWRPLRVLGELLAVYQGIPFAIAHDAQYDTDDGDTRLSFTSLSVLPHEHVGVELAYNRGLDDNRALLYDAVSLGTRWEATPKWELEASQTLSQLDNSNLATEFLVRRLGHDFVFELSYGIRAGEGGSSLTFKWRPLLGWRAPTFGSMQALQQARL